MALSVWGKIRFGCKCAELLLAIICMALFMRSAVPVDPGSRPDLILMPITFGSFIIISIGLVLGFATSNKVPKKIDLLYTWIGVALFLAAGGLFLDFPSRIQNAREDRLAAATACGGVSIFTALVFIADIAFSYKDVYEYVPH